MESLGDVLRSMKIQPSTSKESTGDSSDTNGAGACPICGGAGYVRRDLSYDHPEFGRPVPCECQRERIASQLVERLQELSNLGPLRRLSFDNVIESGRSGNPSQQERFRRAVAVARAFASKPDGWLVLAGVSGCGKTHLAASIANQCMAEGRRVFFMVVPDL